MRRSALSIVSTLVMAAPAAGLASPPQKPDLRCYELTAQKLETMAVPLRVRVHLAIKNFGPGSAEASLSRLSWRRGSSGGWTTVRDYQLPFSPKNGGAIWNTDVDLAEGGTYTFKVEVDVGHEVAETSEANNAKTVTKTFSAGTPDLTVTNVDAEITRTTPSGTLYTKVTWDVENVGDGKAAGSFVTAVKVSKNGGSFVELARYTRSNLQAGSAFHYTDTHSFTGVTSLKFRVVTDATGAVAERSNSNNSADSGVLHP